MATNTPKPKKTKSGTYDGCMTLPYVTRPDEIKE